MPTSVALGSHFEDFIRAQLRSGRYDNASEVVREGPRLLEDQEAERTFRLERLRAEVQAGLARGAGREAKAVLHEMEAPYAAKAGKAASPRTAARRAGAR
jgi:antitoxin ParD1/3/4